VLASLDLYGGKFLRNRDGTLVETAALYPSAVYFELERLIRPLGQFHSVL